MERRLEHKRIAVDPLGFKGFVKLNVGNRDAYPGEEIGDRCQVLEPRERLGGSALATTQVGQERDRDCDHNTVVRNTTLSVVSMICCWFLVG